VKLVNKNIPPKVFVGLDIKEDINPEIIKKIVCDFFKIDIDIIFEKTRNREIIEPRQLIQFFCRKFIKIASRYNKKGYRELPLNEIARFTKVTNHATVISNIKRIKGFIDTDKNFKKRIEAIEALINEYNLIANKNKKDA